MGRIVALLRRIKRQWTLISNPFTSYVVLSEALVGELEVTVVNNDKITIALRCKQVRAIHTRPEKDVKEVYELRASCSEFAPEALRQACGLVVLYPQHYSVPIRKNDILDILVNHYVSTLRYQMSVAR